jgi:hypothetical protein
LRLNVAVTPESAVILNVQGPVPAQLLAEPVPPLQPLNIELASAVPVNVIVVPSSTVHVPVLPAQLSVQFDPPVTFPLPVPALVTVNVRWIRLNVAVQVLSASIVTVAVVSAPEQSPVHSAKVAPVSAVAVRVTLAPAANDAEHVPPQSIPAGTCYSAAACACL